MKRPPPPDLEFRAPDCPFCERTTNWDDGLVCRACGAWWREDGTNGAWDDPDAEACPSTIRPYDRPGLAPEHERIRHIVKACILPADHDGKHRDAELWRTWDDHEAANPDAYA